MASGASWKTLKFQIFREAAAKIVHCKGKYVLQEWKYAGGEVLEAIAVALAASVIEGLTLHGGHVEEIAAK